MKAIERIVMWVVTAMALALAALALGASVSPSFLLYLKHRLGKGHPVQAVVGADSRTCAVYDEYGAWLFTTYERAHINSAKLLDLGRAEGLSLVVGTGDMANPGYVAVYDNEGALITGPYDVSDSTVLASYGRRSKDKVYTNHLAVLDVDVASVDGRRCLAVLASDCPHDAARLLLLDDSARTLLDCWHQGILTTMLAADIDGDGAQEIVVAGVANGLRMHYGTPYDVYPVVLFAVDSKSGLKGQVGTTAFDSLPVVNPEWYVAFPPAGAESTQTIVDFQFPTSGNLKGRVVFGLSDGRWYMFDGKGRPRLEIPGDGWIAKHKTRDLPPPDVVVVDSNGVLRPTPELMPGE
jgi:hypothetical protein